MKKIFILFMILLCTGCSTSLEDEETILPDITIPDIKPEVELEPEIEPEVEDKSEYHELMLSYVFIDVINLKEITLPNSINGNKITWTFNNKEIFTVKGGTETFNIKATIGKSSKDFEITFSNNIVKTIFQQELLFTYLFITDNRKLGTSMNPNKIVIHNTANSAPALNEVLYLNSTSNTSSTSFHYAVDDIGVYQAVSNNIYSHHAGNLAINKESIGIEIAKSLSNNNTEKDKCIANAQKLIRLLQMKYNIDDLMTHKDSNGKYCPHDIMDRYGLNRFYTELKDSYSIK